jgi:hemerythrin
MPIARWNDRYETGIEIIDAQHRALLEDLNHLAEVLEGGAAVEALNEGLAGLAQRTIKHFQTEEGLMKEMGYPARCGHLDQHHDLILQVRTLQYLQAKGQAVGREVADHLAGWFDHHIRDADMGYVSYLRAQRARAGRD